MENDNNRHIEKHWYAVYTRPRWEKKVAEALSKRNIENFCPLNKKVRQWADRKKVVYEPLFSSYVFVFASEAEHLSIRQTYGIINFIYWLGTPAKIREEEIKAIQEFVRDYQNVAVESIEVNVADNVRIVCGPLKEQEGSVLEVKNRTVKVYLPSLGYALVAEVERTNVEVITMSNQVPTINKQVSYAYQR